MYHTLLVLLLLLSLGSHNVTFIHTSVCSGAELLMNFWRRRHRLRWLWFKTKRQIKTKLNMALGFNIFTCHSVHYAWMFEKKYWALHLTKWKRCNPCFPLHTVELWLSNFGMWVWMKFMFYIYFILLKRIRWQHHGNDCWYFWYFVSIVFFPFFSAKLN